jgi:hypothetical protein
MSEKHKGLVGATEMIMATEHFPSLRGIAVDWEDNTIVMCFYNDGEISEELENDYRCVGTEVVAQYSDAYIHEEIMRVDSPQSLPQHKYWAYKRKE